MSTHPGVVGDAHTHDDHGPAKGLLRWITTTNHKDIGTLYLMFAWSCSSSAAHGPGHPGRAGQPGLQFVDPQFYNSMTTMHALIMIFGAVMPAFVGLANWMIPMMIGAPDMALPRMNNWSFWILPFAFSTLLLDAVAAGRWPGRWLDHVPAAVLQTGDAFPFLIFACTSRASLRSWARSTSSSRS
jgi:cytochrome c oxidase subunit 1